MEQIANPIYDVVFKYMMEDNAVARLVASSIIKEDVIELEARPQEYTTDKKKEGEAAKSENTSLTVYRLDFSAKIKTPDGYKLILIEMQKANLPTDVMRFRLYLGRQYSNPANSMETEDGKRNPMQIYAIYFFGKDLEMWDTPLFRIDNRITDCITEEVIDKSNPFIDGVHHKSWVVQISCLKKRRRNELEQFLDVFSQINCSADYHILNVRKEDYPEKYWPVIQRLKMAASSPELKRKMQEEDEYLRYFQDAQRSSLYEGLVKGREEGRAEREALKAESETLKADLKAKDADLKAAQAKIEAMNADTVMKGYRANVPTETISMLTGLSVEQISKIIEENK